MTGREVQLLHLVLLAVELDALGRSCTIALRAYDVPVLYVPRAVEKLKIKAELRGEQWFYAWGRSPSNRVPADGRAARGIAAMAR
ncbi:hypothetical protein [Actinomadura physcomitrii]|uniref:hypothetical protein n=1 Tax=Actinomadura physcomitrii TaxID=2650748 RepID=UPI00136A70D9|nr:hypothetical protein [Actinomadura physcomitrii]